MPVWLLLAPRDYLSTFLKLGTVVLLGIAIVITHPVLKMPALTAVHRWHRADVRRQGLSVRVHHHRLRGDLRVPLR